MGLETPCRCLYYITPVIPNRHFIPSSLLFFIHNSQLALIGGIRGRRVIPSRRNTTSMARRGCLPLPSFTMAAMAYFPFSSSRFRAHDIRTVLINSIRMFAQHRQHQGVVVLDCIKGIVAPSMAVWTDRRHVLQLIVAAIR